MSEKRYARSNSFVMLLGLIVVVVSVSVLMVGTIAYRASAKLLEEQTRKATLLQEAQLLSRMDLSVLGYQSIAQGLSSNKPILDHLTQTSSKSVSDILRFREIMQAISSMKMGNPSVSLISVYFHRSSTVLTHSTRYSSTEFFARFEEEDKRAIIRDLAMAQPFSRRVRVSVDGYGLGTEQDVLLLAKSLPYFSSYPFGGVFVEVPISLLEQMLMPEEGAAQIVLNERGEVLLSKSKLNGELPTSEVLELIGSKNFRAGTPYWLDARFLGNPYFVTVSVSPADDWKFVTLIPAQSIYQGLSAIRWVTLLGGLITAVTAIIISALILKKLYTPIRQLLTALAVRGMPYRPKKDSGSDLNHISHVIDIAWHENARMQGFVVAMESVARQDVLGKLLDNMDVDSDTLAKLRLEQENAHFRVLLPDSSGARPIDYVQCLKALEGIAADYPGARLTAVARANNQAAILMQTQDEPEMPMPLFEALLACLSQDAPEALLVVSEKMPGIRSLSAAYRQAQTARNRALMLGKKGVVEAREMLEMEPRNIIAQVSREQMNSKDALRGLFAEAMESGDYPMAFLASAIEQSPDQSDAIEQVIAQMAAAESPDNELDALVQLPQAKRLPGRRIVAYLEAHYEDANLSLTMLADTFGYTPSYISALLKEETDVGFLEYLTKLRIERAQDLLVESGMKVSEISDAVGFGHVNTFIRTFRKYQHMTPAQYRASQKGEESSFAE